jgi:hypothetical protein
MKLNEGVERNIWKGEKKNWSRLKESVREEWNVSVTLEWTATHVLYIYAQKPWLEHFVSFNFFSNFYIFF